MYRSWGTIQTDSVLDAMANGVGGAVSHMKPQWRPAQMWDWSLRKRCLWGVRLAFRCHSILCQHKDCRRLLHESDHFRLSLFSSIYLSSSSLGMCARFSLSLSLQHASFRTPLLFLISSSLFKNLYSFDPCSSPNPRVVFPVQHHDWWCFRWWIHDLPLSFNLYIWSDEPCK